MFIDALAVRRFSLVLFVCAGVSAAPPLLTEPYWLVPTNASPSPITGSLVPVPQLTSNNNLAIQWHQGRLYFAFRSATHHHPRPPIWSPQYLTLDRAETRLYMMSAAASKDQLSRIPQLTLDWRLEQELSSRLTNEVFTPQLSQLLGKDGKRDTAVAWWRDLYKEGAQLAAMPPGTSVADALKQYRSFLTSFDLREPFFFVFNGKLHFYFQQIEGKSMAFNTLRTWHQSLEYDGEVARWTVPQPILKAAEHFWDIQARGSTAYLSSYSGSHYTINKTDARNLVHFRQSTDGVKWTSVDGKDHVYQGGASEAALLFRATKLFVVMRLDDGDERGWGALFGWAGPNTLATWALPARANPGRFDSPRLFEQDGQVYLMARQNLCPQSDGKFDLTRNCPFDRAFLDEDSKKAMASREGILGKIQRKLMSLKMTTATADQSGIQLGDNPGVSLQYEYTYYFDTAKRTALYKWNESTLNFDWVLSLPSSGDTAFPSMVRLNEKEWLIANYTSPIEKPDYSWREGQQNRTGIYLVKMTFR